MICADRSLELTKDANNNYQKRTMGEICCLTSAQVSADARTRIYRTTEVTPGKL